MKTFRTRVPFFAVMFACVMVATATAECGRPDRTQTWAYLEEASLENPGFELGFPATDLGWSGTGGRDSGTGRWSRKAATAFPTARW